MNNDVYQYLFADDDIRQFALRIVGDEVISLAVFAENPADAKLQPGEIIFARNDLYALSAGIASKEDAGSAKDGYSIFTHVYKIKADSAGNPLSVTEADCTYYSRGTIHKNIEKQQPQLIFKCTRQSASTLSDFGFGGCRASFALPLPQRMLAVTRMEIDFDVSFEFLKKIPPLRATIARDAVEKLCLPKASPDPLWIAPDNKAQANNYCTITKTLRKNTP